MYRDHTRTIKIGDRVIGGGNPVLIQSMTNTRTEDVEQTVKQILELERAGCEIIRCAVPTMEAAKALAEIKKQIHIPLVADIHFDYKLAIAAMENGADKILELRRARCFALSRWDVLHQEWIPAPEYARASVLLHQPVALIAAAHFATD